MNQNEFDEMIKRIEVVLKEYGINDYEIEKAIADVDEVVFANIKIDCDNE